jgi:hypothetical protein
MTHKGFHPFIDADGEKIGSFEVFEVSPNHPFASDPDNEPFEHGWYWWPCYPGCLPDSMPWGPFKSAKEAYDDAIGDIL